jgi:hypothetical protein
MPIKESKEYEKTAEELGTIGDGIHIHAGEDKFPPSLDETDVRNRKSMLETARKNYEKAQADADQKHKDFEAVLKTEKAFVSGAQRILQGYYALRSQYLKDFGFQPPKISGKKGPRLPKTK